MVDTCPNKQLSLTSIKKTKLKQNDISFFVFCSLLQTHTGTKQANNLLGEHLHIAVRKLELRMCKQWAEWYLFCSVSYVCAVREPEQWKEVPLKSCIPAELRAGGRPQDHRSTGDHQCEHTAIYWTLMHTSTHWVKYQTASICYSDLFQWTQQTIVRLC